MEGKTNWAYINDNDETLETGSIENGFYRSKLVIDFSREDLPDCTEENESYVSPTKRIEIETAHKKNSKKVRFSTNDVQHEGTNSSIKVKCSKLFFLYCIGFVLIAIGLSLITIGIIYSPKNELGKNNIHVILLYYIIFIYYKNWLYN